MGAISDGPRRARRSETRAPSRERATAKVEAYPAAISMTPLSPISESTPPEDVRIPLGGGYLRGVSAARPLPGSPASSFSGKFDFVRTHVSTPVR